MKCCCFEEENEKLKTILKNIKMYLSDKVCIFTDYETQSLPEQIKQIENKAKNEAYSDILKYIEENGY